MMSEPADVERYRANLQDETDSAFLYRSFAAAEKQPEISEVFRRLAEVEEKHGRFWADQIRQAGAAVPEVHPGWRSRILARLARTFGVEMILPTVAGMETGGSASYRRQPETSATLMPAEEQSHDRVLRSILRAAPHGVEGSWIARFEGRHRAIGGNALRAAVLGANDGLLSNLSLVMGVAGADLTGKSILITGFAGLLAGSFSMALGEWLSVQSSRELYQRQIAIESGELKAHPEEEKEELALIYQAKGIAPDQAAALAKRLLEDPTQALDTLAREELGIDPGELGGSAWEAAISSFCLFAVGAIIPVIPFFFLSGLSGIAVSLTASVLGLYGIGAAITLMTGRSVLVSGGRQVLFGLLAAGITFGIGKLMGVGLG
ncbi:MAG TPA: VIT1/CCC1 transporter family protein [Thermoanaerobaculia bacterium]|nr:VIT1/CCC1 transporter family protein [Thermoanaerobaculia bacterium]